VSALSGALRLAALDRRGIDSFDPSAAAAWRSCALFTPLLLGNLAIDLLGMPADVDALPYLLLSAVGLLLQMSGYLLAAAMILERSDAGARLPLFVSTYNWCSVVTTAANVVGALVASQSVPAIANGVAIGLMFWGLYYSWFSIRAALACPGAVAVGLVLLEILVAIGTQGFISQLALAGPAG